MDKRQPPPALTRAGIRTFSDNLPPGAGVAIAADFVRVFRAEIERRAAVPGTAPALASPDK